MITRILKKVAARLLTAAQHHPDSDLDAYVRGGRRPWSRGYLLYRDRFIARTLADEDLLERFRSEQPLPAGYGEFLDDRVVEYPWLFAQIGANPGRILDAGSILNHAHLLAHSRLGNKNISMVTLAPEANCFWQNGISYVYADLRDLPFRDNYFDEVVCISTLEHVGKDNTLIYTADRRFKENHGQDFRLAVKELKRVCKPGGKVCITVPFGRYTDFGWYQQFDATLLDAMIATFAPAKIQQTFFRYAGGGWQFSTKEACADCEGFNIHATRYMDPTSTRDYDPDYAAASRANAAIQLFKS